MLSTLTPRVILSLLMILFGLIIAAVPENTTKPYKLTSDQLLEEIKGGTQFIHPDQVADMLINKDPYLRLIDVRSPDEYDKFHLPGAINVPLDNILSDQWTDILDQDVNMNVLYSNGTTHSNEAWMIVRQLGYTNNFVLEGGLNYWVETIMNPSAPSSTSPADEFARYDFRKGAGMALGAGSVTPSQQESASTSPKPTITTKIKKKKVASGGCS
ncbi:MAG: rhodanese-like domain-containing protein [Bacteroidales bacterium]|nr:rhodanese-like domain-containing protein [Lentimicrobiaceae bacterium]MDD5693694.1 rhodanese-like domain-containing protein [Bacteroidales bacterium]